MRFLFGECELDTERYKLHRVGQVVPLEPQAFRVLVYLVQHHGRAVAKQDLLQAFWPGTSDEYYKQYSLRNCLHKIRQAVGDAGTQRAVIETVRSYGYRLAAAVTTLAPDPGVSGAAPQSQEPDSRPPASSAPPLLPGWRQVTVPCCELVENASLARLDRLPQAREVAQLGAVLGRDFSYEVLQAVAGLDALALQQCLAQLVDTGLSPPLRTTRLPQSIAV